MNSFFKKEFLKNNYVKFLTVGGIILVFSGCASPKILEDRGTIPPPTYSPYGPDATSSQADNLDIPVLPEQQINTPKEGASITSADKLSDFPQVNAKEVKYLVKRGESFWTISQKYGVGMKELAAYNNLDTNKPLKAGTTIIIPPGGRLKSEVSTVSKISTVKSNTYTVKHGDSLWGISKKFGVTVAELTAANGITKDSALKVGKKITIPGKTTTDKNNSYTVKHGDSLWGISKKFGVTVAELTTANGITKNSPLKVGQKLNIPTKTAHKSTKTSSGKNSNYTVRPGDSLWIISKRFGTTVSSITAANGISKNSVIKVGQKIYIPNKGTEKAIHAVVPTHEKNIIKKEVAQTYHKENKLTKEDSDLLNDLINTPEGKQQNHKKSKTAKEIEPKSVNYLPHTVKDGDTWDTISEMYGVGISNLKKANPKESSKSKLSDGTVINIPEE
jgi:LysM repeat protein